MRRQGFAVVTLATAFALAAPSAWAQRPCGTPAGTAEPRSGGGDSGGGGSAAPRGGDSGGGNSGGNPGTSSPGPSSASSPPSPGYVPNTPSAERVSYAPQRRGGGGGGGGGGSRGGGGNSGGGGERAVPRGSSGGGSGEGSRGGTRQPSSTTSSSPGSNDGSGDRRAVPTYSRPEGGRPSRGQAVERTGPRPGGGGVYIVPGYYPYGYSPYGYWGSGYGYGLGYMYDPFWSPLGYGAGGYGYGGFGYSAYGDPYDQGSYGGGGGSGSYDREPRDTGSLRLKIKPREAQVYVDGYLVGDVDSFDGAFQKLGIESGSHRIELKADGYQPLQFDALIPPGETVTYKGELKRVQ